MTRSGRAAAVAAAVTLLFVLSACGRGSHATPGVHIDRDVFGWSDKFEGESNEIILVNGTASSAALVAALNRAAARFMRTDSDGVEHSANENWAVYTNEPDAYTPNYVSTPKQTRAGIELYVDCKGVIGPPMQARLVKILREELESAGGSVTVSAEQ